MVEQLVSSKKLIICLCVALLIPLFSGCGTSPQSIRTNILVMGEDADQTTVARNNRVFKRVLSALSNELNNEGFSVYDETAVTISSSGQGRIRRNDEEIIDIARSVKRPPIDVAVIFSIYTDIDMTAYTQKISVRIGGYLLNVLTGQRLGNFEVGLAEPINARLDCQEECILEKIGQNARILAQDLGAILTTKLAHRIRGKVAKRSPATKTPPAVSPKDLPRLPSSTKKGLPTAYALIFNGFDPSEITRMENNLVQFSGYSHHRSITTSLHQIEYWYETGIDSAELNRSLREMLVTLGIKGSLRFSGLQFRIDKTGLY